MRPCRDLSGEFLDMENSRRNSQESLHETSAGILRIVILDANPQTAEQVERGLWIWPHRIAVVTDIAAALHAFEEMRPDAIIASIDLKEKNAIQRLRRELPTASIVALTEESDPTDPQVIFSAGANAIVTRGTLQDPTLHNRLMNARTAAENCRFVDDTFSQRLAMPWRDSQVFGALQCDVDGRISAANERLSDMLGYSSAAEFSGLSVRDDLLTEEADWQPWRAICGDMLAVLSQKANVKTRAGKMLWMDIEIFAVPEHPTLLQAVFVDQSELAQLTGRRKHA